MSKTSAAVKNRYKRKAYDNAEIIMPKGKKAALKAIAQESGESLNAYISGAILARIGVDSWDEVPDAPEANPDDAVRAILVDGNDQGRCP